MKTQRRLAVCLPFVAMFAALSSLTAQTDVDSAAAALKTVRRPKVEFRLALPQGTDGAKYKTAEGDDLILGDPIGIADEIVSSRAIRMPTGDMSVEIYFSRRGQQELSVVTGNNTGIRLAILVDGIVQSAPVIQEPISVSAVITGDWTDEKAHGIASAIFPPTFKVSLLTIKADWSTVEQVDTIKRELINVLRQVKVQDKFLEAVPGSGTKILFPTNLVSHFTPEHYSQLLTWMSARGLIVSSEDFPVARAEAVPRSNRSRESAATYATTLHKPRSLLNLTFDHTVFVRHEPQPFVSHDLEFHWELKYTLDGSSKALQFARALALVEKKRGQPVVTDKLIDRCTFASPMAPRKISIVNAFPSPEEDEYHRISHAQGIMHLVVIVPGNIEIPQAEAKFVLPDSVEVVEAQHGGQKNLWGPDPKSIAADADPTSVAKPEVIQQTMVVSLQQVNAASAVEILDQLFDGDNGVSIAADPRSNAVILRGDKELLGEIVEVLRRLDEPRGDEKPARKPDGPDLSDDDLAQLRRQYAAAERDARAAAAELNAQFRDARHASDEAKRPLEKLVQQSFELRQQLHQSELARVEKRLKKSRRDMAERERIKSSIVQRRVDDLLAPHTRRSDVNAGKSGEAPKKQSLIETIESKVKARKDEWKMIQGGWVLERSKGEQAYHIRINDRKCVFSVEGEAPLTGVFNIEGGKIFVDLNGSGMRQNWSGSYEIKNGVMALHFTAANISGANQPSSTETEKVLLNWSGVYKRTE